MIDKIMNAIDPLWVAAILWTMASILQVYQHWKQARRQKQDAVRNQAKEKVMFFREPNGWVVVNEKRLAAASEALPPWHTANAVESSVPFELMLVNFSAKYLHETIITVKRTMHDTKNAINEDAFRGLTVGSALFNYSIPESFVLLDERTEALYRRFMYGNRRRHTVDAWLEHEYDFFSRQLTLIGAFEKKHSDSVSVESLYSFYTRYYPTIAHALIHETGEAHFPSITGFTEVLMRRLKLSPNNDFLVHHMRVSIMVMVSLFEMEVPMDWVMTTSFGERLFDKLMGTEPQRPKLTLVKNN